ncbi:hypothetical protein [Pseudanabaena minima]|uniref:hypothetical protein n=1 Tax=Pseudanabaena minima TaxID=890415 RepID=UPI003DA98C47
MNSLEIMFKEYDALRQEVLASMTNRISILSFGIAAVGAIFTASIATYTNQPSSLLISLILTVILPFICAFILFMWLGEYQRMQRAGRFLVELEQKINLEASKEILTWETNLRKQRSHMNYPYNTTVLLLIVISGASQVIGLTNLGSSISIIVGLVIIGIIIHIILYLYMVSLISKLQQ